MRQIAPAPTPLITHVTHVTRSNYTGGWARARQTLCSPHSRGREGGGLPTGIPDYFTRSRRVLSFCLQSFLTCASDLSEVSVLSVGMCLPQPGSVRVYVRVGVRVPVFITVPVAMLRWSAQSHWRTGKKRGGSVPPGAHCPYLYRAQRHTS